MSAFSPGAKRSISDAQLASSDAGATSRLGCRPAPFWRFRTSSSASTWMVLPRPMSSARQAPRPSFASRYSQRTPTCWYGRSTPCNSPPGSTCANPCGLRSPCNVSASQGPATTCVQSAWSAIAASSPATSAPESNRMASPNARPLSRAVRSTSRKRSIMLCRCSRSSSIHRPRTNASPSVFESRSWISAAVSVSPSSVTSIRKSSSASLPMPAGALLPTLPVTRGRGGRLPRHAAGMRTTTPAVSRWGTSRRSWSASRGVQRSGWKISPASTISLSQGHVSEARCTGTSRESRRCLLAAPAYSWSACPSGKCCALACAERRVV